MCCRLISGGDSGGQADRFGHRDGRVVGAVQFMQRLGRLVPRIHTPRGRDFVVGDSFVVFAGDIDSENLTESDKKMKVRSEDDIV